jgi:methionyl-tRNA formyltransferase
VKPVAEAHGLPLLQPRRVRDPETVAALLRLAPEVQVVVAYGQILPRAVIEIPALGTINVHASLLPCYRGAAPVQWAIANGESRTGVTTMLIDEGLDTGPILLARTAAIGPEETAPELERRLAALGGELLLETLEGVRNGNLRPQPQDHAAATLAPLLKKEDGRIEWTRSALEIERRVRAFTPWPASATRWQGRAIRVDRARLAADGPGAPGEILGREGEGLLVGAGGGTRLVLLELQPEGKRPMSGAAFAAGARPTPGARFQ